MVALSYSWSRRDGSPRKLASFHRLLRRHQWGLLLTADTSGKGQLERQETMSIHRDSSQSTFVHQSPRLCPHVDPLRNSSIEHGTTHKSYYVLRKHGQKGYASHRRTEAHRHWRMTGDWRSSHFCLRHKDCTCSGECRPKFTWLFCRIRHPNPPLQRRLRA